MVSTQVRERRACARRRARNPRLVADLFFDGTLSAARLARVAATKDRATLGVLWVTRTALYFAPNAGVSAVFSVQETPTLEARISVSVGPIRLLLGPSIISARGLEIWTQKYRAHRLVHTVTLK